jgi:Co/Zn/Cd efflux system component
LAAVVVTVVLPLHQRYQVPVAVAALFLPVLAAAVAAVAMVLLLLLILLEILQRLVLKLAGSWHKVLAVAVGMAGLTSPQR